VPVEKQAERLVTPLERRDRRFLLVLGLVALAAIVAGAIYGATRSGGTEGGRCFTAHLQSTMGGVTVHHCGADAVHYCRFNATVPQVAVACRMAGFKVGHSPSPNGTD
jgi:hypothetical protein